MGKKKQNNDDGVHYSDCHCILEFTFSAISADCGQYVILILVEEAKSTNDHSEMCPNRKKQGSETFWGTSSNISLVVFDLL